MKKKKISYNLIISIIVLILVLLFAIYIVLYKRHAGNFKLLVLIVGLLFMIPVINILNQVVKKKEFGILSSILVIIFGVCTFFVIKTPTNIVETKKIPNFVGKNISEAISWCSKNNIEIVQNYEYSDIALEDTIFAQDISENTSLNKVDRIVFTVSSGYNYDKFIILPSFVGQDVELLLTEKESLHLNNVIINYETNEYIGRNIIVSQSKSGEIRRNDEVKVIVSLGKKSELTESSMPYLIGKSLFDATLLLEQNAINYEIKYDFSNEPKNTIIAQSVPAESVIKPFSTKVVITVSKGSKILVPNLVSMSVPEIVKWITDNNLKISLSDEYNGSIEIGKVVSANYKENDEVSEGTTIKIVTSKGPLKMPSFKSLTEFRRWADEYNIKYDEEYVFNNSVSKGNIIKFSLSTNDLIDLNNTIIVTISNGKAVTIPNFVGKSKTEITSSCNKIGLSCSFSYGSYSTTPKDVAMSQNKKAGSSVISGTSVIITLSKGTAKTYTIEISESQLSIGSSCDDVNHCATITTLKKYFANNYPGVTFTYYVQKSNVYSRPGFIHENSQVNDGKKVTPGNTYKVIVTK